MEFASKLTHKSDPAQFWKVIKGLKSKWVRNINEVQNNSRQDSYEQEAISKICTSLGPNLFTE